MLKIFQIIRKTFTHPSKAIDVILLWIIIHFAKPKALCDYLYFHTFKHKINWERPEDLNQWIAWLQFNTDTSLWVTLADKFRMQTYIKSKGYEDITVPILAVWETADQIDFTHLPTKFVLKCNNGSGDVLIIQDKDNVKIDEVKKYFRNQLSRKFGRNSAEPHYLKIEPLIIAEQLLDVRKQSIDSSSLIDYKLWCFNGKVDRVFVCSDRTKNQFVVDLYDKDWNNIADGNMKFDSHHLKASKPMPKPFSYDRMVAIASELSKGLPEVRIDFYEIDGKPYLGEFTLTSASGRMDYFTEGCLIELGNICAESVKELCSSGILKRLD